MCECCENYWEAQECSCSCEPRNVDMAGYCGTCGHKINEECYL